MDIKKTTKKVSIGDIGEEIACGYLVEIGYRIIERNKRFDFGEIDIVAKSQDKTLVFVEVKTIKRAGLNEEKSLESYPQKSGNIAGLFTTNIVNINPEDNMTQGKLKRFKRVAQWYANKNEKEVNKNGYRLDVVAIELINNERVNIRHYKNI